MNVRTICARPISWFAVLLAAACGAHALADAASVETLGQDLTVVYGAVNGATLHRNEKILAIYGDPENTTQRVDTVLFTHHRRDVVWAGRKLVEHGARAVVPAQEAELFAHPEIFWSKFRQARFHDYAQQSSKVLSEPLAVSQAVQEGTQLEWEGLSIRVLDTPGYTRGAVTYLVPHEGQTIAFTGDLIIGDGRLFDLYSLQDAIPEAKVGGYHGYAGRLGQLIASLRKVAAAKPDLLIPVRGPIIRNPQETIEKLIRRIQAVYANYLSIDALLWYFKDAHMQAKAKRILDGPYVGGLPMAELYPGNLPPWILAIDNSRVILAADGSAFLVDCGSPRVLTELKQRRATGKLTSLDGVFITHYHDDHTDQVPAVVQAFGSTVYAYQGLSDLLDIPGAYRLPCLTTVSIGLSGKVSDQATWRWKEFQLTVYNFPGQTLYHDALLVQKDGGDTVFFIGDSFTPTGIDDYCLQNRNFLHPGMGHFQCLKILSELRPDAWLINEHVEPAFRYSAAQKATMEKTLEARVPLLTDLFPWDDPNYGLDESWARFYPYATQRQAGETGRCRLNLMNHSPQPQTYTVKVHLPKGWDLVSTTPAAVRIPPREEGSVEVRYGIPKGVAQGGYVLTADVQWPGADLREWTEAMVQIGPADSERH